MGFIPTLFSRAISSVKSNGRLSLAEAKAKAAEQAMVPTSEIPDSNQKLMIQKKLLSWTEEAIAKDKPHFKVGGKQIYFPKARVILLRPNAKHTPYQAKFIVPKSFNKLDLRDYLYHVYGLRVLNVTTQLLHAKHYRLAPGLTRIRHPQIKKMTVDMIDPFIWPEEEKTKELENAAVLEELEKYIGDMRREGSDRNKPSEAFDGALGPYKENAQPFIPKLLKQQMLNKMQKNTALLELQEKHSKIDRYISRRSSQLNMGE